MHHLDLVKYHVHIHVLVLVLVLVLALALANVLVLVLVNALLHLALAGVSAESAPENAGNCRVFDGKLSKFVLGIRAIINDV